jgi:hypothetical protein
VKLTTAGIVDVETVQRAERLLPGDETAPITAITGGEE